MPTKIETKTYVYSTFHICWGAQAGLYYHDGIHKHDLQEKLFGVFPHMVAVSKGTPLNRGTCSVTSPEVVVRLRS